MFRNLSTCVLALLLGLPAVALAQGTGTIAGQVTDETGAGLPGANVVVGGTMLGAATDIDGNYRIIGVPVGTYDITASFAGFASETVTGVDINSGYTRDLSFQLGEDDQQLEEVVVEFTRPIIENDAIGAPRVVSGEDIQNLPVRGVAAVAALQASTVTTEGTSDLYIRGGREQEVAYYVDGVKVVNPSGGLDALVGVNQQAIQEQEMLIGSIPARYGDVQAGVISITTRTGGERFFGSAEAITSEGLDAYGYNLVSLSLGGPVVPGRVGFFLSGQGNFEADANPYGVQTYRLSDEAYADLLANPQYVRLSQEGQEDIYVPFPWEEATRRAEQGDTLDASELEGLLGDQIPEGYGISGTLVNAPETFTEDRFELGRGKDDPLQDLTLNGNLNFDLTNTLSLRVGGGLVTRRRETYTFANSLYNRDAFYNDDRDSWRAYGTFRQRLSSNAFYQIQGEFQDFTRVQYPNTFSSDVRDIIRYGDVDDANAELARRYFVRLGDTYARVFDRDSDSRPSVVSNTFSLSGRPNNRYIRQHDQQFRISGSATTQLAVHQVEFGGEYEQQTRRLFDILTAAPLAGYIADADGNESTAPGLPEGGARTYEEIPYEAFRELYTARYGYNYLGTEEVDDEDITQYFPDEATGVRGNTNLAPYKPIYYAGYVQDKIEFQDLVINLGLRVDVFDNNAQVLRDPFAPQPIQRVEDLQGEATQGLPSNAEDDWAVYFNSSTGAVVGYRDVDGIFYNEEGSRVRREEITQTLQGIVQETDEPREAAFEEYTPKVSVMPRVGVSFPVTDRALFFASYNVTSQRPTEQAFATIADYEVLTGQDQRIPNPRLEPELTTQYELGFRQRLGERAALTLSGFFRTQDNKISNRRLDGGAPSYGTYLNADFTTTKGLEVGFDLRRTNNLAVTANYTLSFAQGTGSDAGATATIVWRGSFFPDFISPADFDQRHTANVTVDYRFAENEGPMVGGVRLLENFGVNVLGQFGSGQRYTPLETPGPGEGFSVIDSFSPNARGTINSATLPATSRIDLRVDRGFNLGFGGASLKAYLWVQNIFNTRNVLAVYRSTGLPDEDYYLISDAGDVFLNNAPDAAGRAFNYAAYTSGPVNNGGSQSSGEPFFYGLPRRIRLGLLLDF